MKFKVGDKIEHERYGKGRILKINDCYGILVEFENEEAYFHDGDGLGKDRHCYWVNKDSIKQTITKEELFKMPIETKITTDLEENNIFVKVGENDFCNNDCDHIEYDNIKEDLSLDYYEGKIIEIQEPNYTIIYKEDKQVKEMTIAEIEKELGYPIKVIKEKED